MEKIDEGKEQHDVEGYKTITTGAGLIKFMDENGILFHMNEQEAELLCEYMDGHGYVIGQKDGQLCLGDLCAETDRIVWEETTIDDLVDFAAEWNYELLQEAKSLMEKSEDFMDFLNQHSRYEDLCADEKVLDAMFERTKYGKQIERIAETLVEHFIQNMQSKGGVDEAVKELVQGIKDSEKEKTAPKQEKGRSR